MLSGVLLALTLALPVSATPGEPVPVPREARAVDTSHPDRWVGDGTAASAEATITFQVRPRVALDEPTIPTLPDGDPEDSTVPSTLASTGSAPSWALGVLAALIAATGFVLVRSSRRVA